MTFVLEHVLISKRLAPTTHVEGEETFFRVADQGTFDVLFPGRLYKNGVASVTKFSRDPQVPADPTPASSIEGTGTTHPPVTPPPAKGGLESVTESLAVTLTIVAPDGKPFTADEVTMADLEKYRDLRGLPREPWSYTLGGESRRYNLLEEANEKLGEPSGEITISVWETVALESAPPLISGAALDGSRQSFSFDLFRVGTFVADVATTDQWNGSMRLLDPDGTQVAATASKTLRHDIDLRSLGTSRDRNGRPREWTLQVSPQGGVVVGSPTISAQVYGLSRVTTSVIADRVLKLLGEHGHFIHLFGRNKNGYAQARLIVEDPAAAEAIEMHDLLEKPLSRVDQDPPLLATNIIAGAEYTLYSTKQTDPDWYGIWLDVGSLEVETIDVSLGMSKQIPGHIPAINVKVKTKGEARAVYHNDTLDIDVTLGTAKPGDDSLEVEVGIAMGDDGVPRVVTWIQEDLFDADVDWQAIGALALLPGGLLVAGVAVIVTEILETWINGKLSRAAEALFGDPDLAPGILMTILGAHLTYTSIHVDGNDFVFEYVAPLEPDPKPREEYVGVIGRDIERLGDGRTRLRPESLGDTWAADNLKAKIDHIVVVMMENRSFDHVLGYRAADPINESSDGLTPAVIAAIQGDPQAYTVRNLATAKFPQNEVGMMTRLPKGVSHSHKAVTEQLSVRIPGPDGREINGAEGFVKSFTPRIGSDDLTTPTDERLGVVPDDVLGYYDGAQLPMYEFLARNYGYCDRFFSSHPGPTLPNRMYSLTGDLQHDRLGVPIIENNHLDTFQLSRAETIYDALTKRGVEWRIYESAPSVTMLRMFARYATDATNIVPISELETDLATRGLPPFCVIEPAMHHHPQDDDHPDADMWRGQRFIRRVYEALRALPSWERTLLIITYDEHGGLYDHVVPPIADVLELGRESGGVIGVTGTVSDGGGAAPDGGPVTPPSEPPPGTVSLGSRWADRHRLISGDRVGDTTPTTSDGTRLPPPVATTIEIPYGVRVPTFVVSPWAPPGKAESITLDFCSILKTVLARFSGEDRPFLSDRVEASHSFDRFLSEAAPRVIDEVPPEIKELSITVRRLAPDASAIDTPFVSKKAMREGPVESHDLMGRVARMLGR